LWRSKSPFSCGYNLLFSLRRWVTAVFSTTWTSIFKYLLVWCFSFFLRFLHIFHMKFIVPFVTPEILWAWQLLSKQVPYWQEHVWCDLLIDLLKLFEINPLFISKAYIQDLIHLLKSFDSLFEVTGSSSILSELSFWSNWD
jgi:hypothetical protein